MTVSHPGKTLDLHLNLLEELWDTTTLSGLKKHSTEADKADLFFVESCFFKTSLFLAAHEERKLASRREFQPSNVFLSFPISGFTRWHILTCWPTNEQARRSYVLVVTACWLVCKLNPEFCMSRCRAPAWPNIISMCPKNLYVRVLLAWKRQYLVIHASSETKKSYAQDDKLIVHILRIISDCLSLCVHQNQNLEKYM